MERKRDSLSKKERKKEEVPRWIRELFRTPWPQADPTGKLQSGPCHLIPTLLFILLSFSSNLFFSFGSNRQAGVRQFKGVFPVGPPWDLLPSGCWHRAAAVISKHDLKTRPPKAVQQSYLPGTGWVYWAYQWSGRIAKSECKLGECQGWVRKDPGDHISIRETKD